jgi:hypothetical protein
MFLTESLLSDAGTDRSAKHFPGQSRATTGDFYGLYRQVMSLPRAHRMTDPEIPERQDENRRDGRESGRRPFDTSELNSIPPVTEDDPPYRNWWVIVDQRHGRTR